jgi:glycosyltransferase involved in cell wall biosynthesis
MIPQHFHNSTPTTGTAEDSVGDVLKKHLLMADVSVVIATHNRAAQVKVAIDSVLAQTERALEVIVVDDGSVDNTRDVLLSYGDRIRPFFQSASGASAARNRAMREARGTWLGFLDDDDVWLPEKLQQQIAVARQDPRIALIYCSDHAVDDNLRILHTRHAQPTNKGDVFELLLLKNFIFTSCVIARRDAVAQAGYMDPAFRFAQDWDLWLKLAAKFHVGYAEEPLVLYRHSNSGCLTRDMKAAERLAEMQAIVEQALHLRRVPPDIERRARCELEWQWATTWLLEGQHMRALPHSLRAIRLRPAAMESHRLLMYTLVPARVREWSKTMLRA